MKVQSPFWIILSIIGTCLVGIYYTQAEIFYRILISACLLLTIAFFWAVLSIQGFKFNRTSRGSRYQQGAIFEENFELLNKIKLSRPWVTIEDLSELTNHGVSRVITWMAGNSIRNFVAHSVLLKRGSYPLGPTVISAGDPFGFFRFSKKVKPNSSLLVLPYSVEIKSFPGARGIQMGGLSSRKKNPEKIPPQVSGLREYAPGDPLNFIHWPLTAKRDRWMVKEFEHDPKTQVWIILDGCSKFHLSNLKDEVPGDEGILNEKLWWIKKNEFTLPRDTFEYSTAIAATLTRYYIRHKIPVGFISMGQRKYYLPSDYGEAQGRKINETLALLEPKGKISLAGIIEGYAPSISPKSCVILITPCCENDTLHAVDVLVRKNFSPILILLDQASFGGENDLGVVKSKISSLPIPKYYIKYGDRLEKALDNE